MAHKESERRKFVRFAYPFFVLYQKVEKRHFKRTALSAAKWERAPESAIKRGGSTITKNISEGGICFVTRERFEPDVLLRVKLYIPTRNEPIKALVKVIWAKKRKSRVGYDTGVSFLEVEKEDRAALTHHLLLFSWIKLEELMEIIP